MKSALASSEVAPAPEANTHVLYTVCFTLTVPPTTVPPTPTKGASGTGAARSVDFLDREEAEAFARVLLRGSREEGGEELVSAVEVHEEVWF